jgi:hypothetical protein
VTVINTSVQFDKEAKLNYNAKKRRPRGRSVSEASAADTSFIFDASIQVSGPSFSAKDIGPHGKAFIARFLGTQMYSGYCVTLMTQMAEVRFEGQSTSPKSLSARSDMKRLDLGADIPYDPWTVVFTLLQIGTCPLKRQAIESLKLDYSLEVFPPSYTESRESLGDLSHLDTFVCNGQCGGKADTPECTYFCVELWTEKVRMLRHQVLYT